jgi:hypothetical protein
MDKAGVRTRYGRIGNSLGLNRISTSDKRWISRPLYDYWCGLRMKEFRKKSCIHFITRDHVPRCWNLLLLMLMVVRGSPRIHVRADGRERVAERRTTTSARSCAPAVLGLLRVTQEGIVGPGRVSE